jgi:DNA helicase HerA-like ATPase
MQDPKNVPGPDAGRASFKAALRGPSSPGPRTAYRADPRAEDAALPLPEQAVERLDADMATMGEAYVEPAIYRDSIGRTMFDSPASEDNTITVLLAREQIEAMPAQSLVRIVSTDELHRYIGVVVKGPFAEPDGLRADAPVIVTTTVRGGILMPRYHGRVQVELLGEELPNGELEPPRFRPLPNSPVFVLTSSDTARIMQTDGDIRLGLAVGHEDLPVAFPLKKSVLPRHTGILGTTGSGKSTTVSGLIAQLQRQGVATVLIDTEGEYTEIDQPTDDRRMLARLEQLGKLPQGVQGTALYHLVGRDTSNPSHQKKAAFSLRLSKISPFALSEILEFNEPQDERFAKAYDLTKLALERTGIYPRPNNEGDRRQANETDEFDRGWPGMTLQHLHDVVSLIALHTDKHADEWRPRTPQFAGDPGQPEIKRLVANANLPGSLPSWRAVLGKLGQLVRLRVFDSPEARALDFEALIRPGSVSIVDLSDTESPKINNLVIAELLRGVMDHQDDAYKKSTADGTTPTPVVVIIEEAHEFLSAERIRRMQVLFEQVARIAKRGRKRWLGLVFVTQLPQHLPDEVLGLINNWVLHKISDAGVVARLRRSIGRVDDSLWQRLPSLAPGQAVVAIEGMARPMLVAIDPTACKLRMID